jgi:ketosteroid isomerase-like protein
MADDIAVLRSGYQAFNRGDIDAVAETMEDDVEFVGPNSQRMTGAGPYQGRVAVTALLSGMHERWDNLTWSPDEFVSEGETVVVLGHMEGRAKATGKEIKVPFVHVWRMRAGRASHGKAFTDTAVVADALGG